MSFTTIRIDTDSRGVATLTLARPDKHNAMSSAMIADLVKGATKYGLEIPADFLLVGKSIMTIEGIGKEIELFVFPLHRIDDRLGADPFMNVQGNRIRFHPGGVFHLDVQLE